MKTSVVIPATNGNFGYLNCILRHYEDGSLIPDEVVISISNAHLIESGEIDRLEDKFSKSFELKILRHREVMIQGPNRDAATTASTGDIIISNDADDIPHPHRVQIIKSIFLEHDIVHLNHGYQTERLFYPVQKIEAMRCEDVFNYHFPGCDPNLQKRPNPMDFGFHGPYGGDLSWQIHAGCPTFRKEVFNKIRWRHTEQQAWDYDFCMDVLYYFNKSMIIDTPLIWYNQSPSRTDLANAELGHNLSTDLGELYKE